MQLAEIYLDNPLLLGEKGKPIIISYADVTLHFWIYSGLRRTCLARVVNYLILTRHSFLSNFF